ncbi:hypothetical protein BY458DRAFT_507924 [Sporodiniella umbellata]|nr:hypothetical protein BY458DRAFT_507924 [Sporodiniella umbellata]
MSPTTVPNFITPDSLLKQPTQRVTRSRTTAPVVTTTYKKKRASKPKKLYCICQQPYNGKPMVQCDQCEDWFHCACVHFDPEEQEDVDWICDGCKGKPLSSFSFCPFFSFSFFLALYLLETTLSVNTHTYMYLCV